MRTATRAASVLVVLLLGTGCSAAERPAPAAALSTAAPETGRPRVPSGPPRVTSAAAAPLLVAARGGDGDSWRDTAGREYRLGMVNAPEVGDCFGSQATAERKRLVSKGFRAQVYTKDRYGRGVSVVTTASGVVVNVDLARHGFVDDRYLAKFRSENPALARQLDTAFAAAKAERAGLWSACSGSAPQGLVAAPPRPAPGRD